MAKRPDPVPPADEEALHAFIVYAELKYQEGLVRDQLKAQAEKVKRLMPPDGAPIVLPSGVKIRSQPGRVTLNVALLQEELPELYAACAAPAVDPKKFEAAAAVIGLDEAVVSRYRQVGDPYLIVQRPKP